MEKQANCDRISPVFSSEPHPSFSKSSCMGTGSIQEQETNLESTANKSKENQSGVSNQAIRPEILDTALCEDTKGWTIELSKMLKFTEDSLSNGKRNLCSFPCLAVITIRTLFALIAHVFYDSRNALRARRIRRKANCGQIIKCQLWSSFCACPQIKC